MIPLLLAATLMQSARPVRTLDKGTLSQIDLPQEATARSAEEWDTLWTRHAGRRPRPAVDFGRDMVVAVFLGHRPTGGFVVEIVGTRQEGSTLIVEYREAPPPPDAMTAQVITSPYHVVAVRKHAQVRFEKAGATP